LKKRDSNTLNYRVGLKKKKGRLLHQGNAYLWIKKKGT